MGQGSLNSASVIEEGQSDDVGGNIRKYWEISVGASKCYAQYDFVCNYFVGFSVVLWVNKEKSYMAQKM